MGTYAQGSVLRRDASHAFWSDGVPLVESRSPARRECRLETRRRREIIDRRDCRAVQSIDQKTPDAPGFPKVLEARVAKDAECGSPVGAFSPRSASMGVLSAEPLQIAKRMKIPNAAIVTRTPAIHTPIIHRMRLISLCAMSVRSLSKAVSFWAISVRSFSKAP